MRKSLICLSAIALNFSVDAQVWSGSTVSTNTTDPVRVGTTVTSTLPALKLSVGGNGLFQNGGASYNSQFLIDVDSRPNGNVFLRTSTINNLNSGAYMILNPDLPDNAAGGGGSYVGIGTTAPTCKLDVSGTGKFLGGLYINRSGNDAFLAFQSEGNNAGQLRTIGTNGFGFYSTVLSSPSLFFNNNTGLIGIGTTTPVAGNKLQIEGGNLGLSNGTVLSYGGNAAVLLRSVNNNLANYADPANILAVRQFEIVHVDGTVEIANRRDGGSLNVTADKGTLNLLSSQKVAMYTAGTQRMAIDASGNVGIGTTTPSELVQFGDRFVFQNGSTKILGFNFKSDPSVVGNVRILPNMGFSQLRFSDDGAFVIQNATAGPTGVPIAALGVFTMDGQGGAEFKSNTSGSDNLTITTTTYNNADIAFKSFTNQSDILYFEKNTTTLNSVLRVNKAANGHMELTFDDRTYGTGNDVVKFKVGSDGIVYAHTIKVQEGNFPDYVFAKEYKLMPLNELDEYITENSHLPNINTAADVKENGLSIGEMQVKQMEKIEELTLYIIQLKKEIDALKEAKK